MQGAKHKHFDISTTNQNSQHGLRRVQLASNIVFVGKNSSQKQQNSIIQQTSFPIQCRICLQNSEQSIQIYVKPCQCTGSVMYVHQICFTQWIKTILKQKSNRQLSKILNEGLQCELCKMKFAIRLNHEKVCTNWQKLKEKIHYHKMQFTALFIFLILSIVFLSITSVMMPKDVFKISLSESNQPGQRPKSQFNQWQKIVLLTSQSILIVLFCLIIYLLITGYGFSYRVEFSYKGKALKTMKGIIQQ